MAWKWAFNLDNRELLQRPKRIESESRACRSVGRYSSSPASCINRYYTPDVRPARDDDDLQPVLDLDAAIRVPNREVTRLWRS
jgi:hypothetical protein